MPFGLDGSTLFLLAPVLFFVLRSLYEYVYGSGPK